MSISPVWDPFESRARYSYKYSIWPRRCYKTNQWLWLTLAVRGHAVWTGPGEPVTEYRWYHKHEGMMIMIKKVSE